MRFERTASLVVHNKSSLGVCMPEMSSRVFPLVKRNWMAFLIAGLFILSTGNFIYAQDPTGRIIGTASDAQGAGIPGAVVTATNVTTQVSKRAEQTRKAFTRSWIYRLAPRK